MGRVFERVEGEPESKLLTSECSEGRHWYHPCPGTMPSCCAGNRETEEIAPARKELLVQLGRQNITESSTQLEVRGDSEQCGELQERLL